MSEPVVLAIVIFVATYALIATERLDKTTAALAGGVAMILLGVVTQEQAFAHIDLNVIFLLAAMMVLAGIIRRTGVFGWMAVRAARVAAGDPYRLLVVLSLVTAVASAVLDNVTTVVLVGPVTLFVAAALGLNPMPLIISEIVASNIGGSATLIGDPPNILIGSAADLDFGAFLVHMLPLAAVVLVGYLLAARLIFRRYLHADADRRRELLALDEGRMIEDPRLLRRSMLVLGLTMIGFVLHGPLNYEPATVALAGAVVLMIVAQQDPREVFHEVEWPTLFFFIGLFMVVAGMIEVGVIEALAEAVSTLTGGALAATSILLLWMSAFVSAIIDNIPYAATMTPLVDVLNSTHGHTGDALWWSLAIGTDYGGNATVIGASANVILIAMADREGHRISFMAYLRYGLPITIGTMLVASAYVWLRYLL
ncbi:MAG TPA: ArsB/NhaD family transporter [Candidatus Limnocylindrales bacterium]|nr:ArsB/NhaD family transporter [Candidatus Limnocylindrales bacterium]